MSAGRRTIGENPYLPAAFREKMGYLTTGSEGGEILYGGAAGGSMKSGALSDSKRALAQPTKDSYRMLKQDAHRGQVRVKLWRSPLPLNVEGMYQTWSKRAQAYWERQERVYGLKFAGFTVEADEMDDTLIVSRAVVDRVLPGERVRW